MDSFFGPVNASTSFSCDPKDLILNFKKLIVAMMTSMCYGINAKSKDFRVVDVLRGYGTMPLLVIKESLTPIN